MWRYVPARRMSHLFDIIFGVWLFCYPMYVFLISRFAANCGAARKKETARVRAR